MNIKSKKAVAFFSIFCAVTAAMASTALADQVSQGGSTGSAVFEADTGITLPLDPDDPEENTDGGTNNTGSLTIDYVPTLNFGTGLTLPTGTQNGIYQAVLNQTDRSLLPRIQVTDKRGFSSGWLVTAQAGLFTYEDGGDGSGNHSIVGAKIVFADGDFLEGTSVAGKPDAPAGFTLECDGNTQTASNVLNAPSGKGMGTWVSRYYPLKNGILDPDAQTNSSIRLEIPPNSARPLAYRCQITWILNDTPAE